jgi:hypothetical protein
MLGMLREIPLLKSNILFTSVLREILLGILLVCSFAKFLFLGITMKQRVLISGSTGNKPCVKRRIP